MKLGYLADLSALHYLVPIATLFITLALDVGFMMLKLARTKLAGILYNAVITYRRKLLEAAPKKSVLLFFNNNPTRISFTGWLLSGIFPAISTKKTDGVNKTISIISEADALYQEHSYKKLRDFLLQFRDGDNAEILWRLARATYEVAKLSSSLPEQKDLNLEAYGYAERALSLDPNNSAAHKWMFILLDKKSSYEGLKERISQSFVVKKHIERACELNRKDATSLHLLGYWCYSVAELPWYQRQIASTLFAAPPVSSYEEALQYFLKAEEVEPNFYSMNLLMIGKSYMRLKNKQEALAYLTRAHNFPAATAEDMEAKQEAAKLLKSL